MAEFPHTGKQQPKKERQKWQSPPIQRDNSQRRREEEEKEAEQRAKGKREDTFTPQNCPVYIHNNFQLLKQ